MSLAFLSPGPMQMMILLVVVLLLFGRRLPETMRSLGKSMNEFKKGVKESEEEEHDDRNYLDKSES